MIQVPFEILISSNLTLNFKVLELIPIEAEVHFFLFVLFRVVVKFKLDRSYLFRTLKLYVS